MSVLALTQIYTMKDPGGISRPMCLFYGIQSLISTVIRYFSISAPFSCLQIWYTHPAVVYRLSGARMSFRIEVEGNFKIEENLQFKGHKLQQLWLRRGRWYSDMNAYTYIRIFSTRRNRKTTKKTLLASGVYSLFCPGRIERVARSHQRAVRAYKSMFSLSFPPLATLQSS